jgi:hypothetical protein
MDDTAHVEFSRRSGELDDIRPYMTAWRKMRYQYYELFDAGNVDEEGNVIHPDSPKAQYQKVSSNREEALFSVADQDPGQRSFPRRQLL